MNLAEMKFLGQGSHGKAYLTPKGNVLKVTHDYSEYPAAIALLKNPQIWSCKILAAEQQGNIYYILKEKVDPVLFEKWPHNYPGYFFGEPYADTEMDNVATMPVELCLGRKHNNGKQALNVRQFNAKESMLLAENYSRNNRKRECYLWFIDVFWKVKKAEYDVHDLWCNIGINNSNKFVFFELMRSL